MNVNQTGFKVKLIANRSVFQHRPIVLQQAFTGCSVRQIGNGMTEVELPLESVTGDWARLIVKDHFGRRAWSNPFKLEA